MFILRSLQLDPDLKFDRFLVDDILGEEAQECELVSVIPFKYQQFPLEQSILTEVLLVFKKKE